MNFEELKESYYEYIQAIAPGINSIINSLRSNELEKAFTSIFHFSEGIEALVKIEQVLLAEGNTINSRINEAVVVFSEVNEAMENGDITLIADIFEYELQPLFVSCSEWIFQEKK